MGERLVRALLVLYPRDFRHRYAGAVIDAFHAQRAERRRTGGPRIAFWRRTLADMCTTAAQARWARIRGAVLRQSDTRPAAGGSSGGIDTINPGSGARRTPPHRSPLGGGVHDLTFALRGLWRRPGFALVAALTLGLGIGLTTAMYSIVDGVLLRGLPLPESDEIVSVRRAHPRRGPDSRVGGGIHHWLDLRRRQTTLEDLAAWNGAGGGLRLADDSTRPEMITGAGLTDNAFAVLGVRPVLGRGFEPADAAPGAAPVAVLSHGLWRERFAADPGIVGETIRINGEPTVVIGIMPEGFAFPYNTRLWVPITVDETRPRGDDGVLWPFGRLREGVTVDEAQAEFDLLVAQLAEQYPESHEGVMMIVDEWVSDFLQGYGRTGLWLALATVSLVLLLACVNVSNLLLVRATSLRRELAVRAALGAGRGRLVRQMLFDAFGVALLGTAFGLAFAALGLRAVLRVFENVPWGGGAPWYFDIGLHPAVLAFSGLVLCASALVSGIAPAWRVSRTDPAGGLKDGGSAGSALRIGRLSRTLVATQVALACVLLFGAGLLGRSIANVGSFDRGLDPDTLLYATVSLPAPEYPDADARLRFWNQLLTSLEADARVGAATDGRVALTSMLPLTGLAATRFHVAGDPPDDDADAPFARLAAVTPAYFEAIGVPVTRGRGFTPADDARAPDVAVVTDSFARRHFGEDDPVGQRLVRYGQEGPEGEVAVIGVVPDVYVRLPSDPGFVPTAGVFVPLAQRPPATARVIARAPTDPLALTPRVRAAVAAVDQNLPVIETATLRQSIDEQGFGVRVFGGLFVIFGAAALLLAAVGLYSVMSFNVRQRTREVGIRVALGAGPARVTRMVLAQGLARIGIGLAFGLLLAFGFGRAVAGFLFGVSPTDPMVLAAIVATLLTAGGLATWIPARRASRVDPLEAMRTE